MGLAISESNVELKKRKQAFKISYSRNEIIYTMTLISILKKILLSCIHWPIFKKPKQKYNPEGG